MRLFASILLVLLFVGCRKEKLKSPEAFFIKTEAVSVSTVSSQGTTSSKITDLWLYVDGNFKGAYPVGHTLPIPSYNGHARVNIYAGIKNNGISTTRVPYDFYQPIEIDTTVNAGSTFSRNLTFTYKSIAKFPFVESFEGGSQGINMIASMDSDLPSFNLVNGSESFEGACMQFAVDNVNQFVRFQSTTLMPLPQGSPVFLEINAKCDQAFEVGIYTSDGQFKQAASVNATPTWNKVYILLSTAIGTNPVTTNQGIYVKAIKSKEAGAPASANIYIDNIKVVTY